MRFLELCYSHECATTVEGKHVPPQRQFELTYLDFLGLKPTMTGDCESCGASQVFTVNDVQTRLKQSVTQFKKDEVAGAVQILEAALNHPEHDVEPYIKDALTILRETI